MRMDWLERKVVFRISRGFFMFFAGLVLLGLVISTIVVGYGVSPTIQGFAPNEPTPPSPPKVSPSELLSRIGESDEGTQE